MTQSIGLFGGTFNPIHNGHLRMALEFKQHLGLDRMYLVPAALPPHRSQPEVSAEQRLAMVKLAVAECEQLQVDDRELKRSTPSYTVDTLESLRQELGEQVSLVLCMGMDSLLGLPSWHRWQEIFELANIAVAARPGWQMLEEGPVAELLEQRQVSAAQLAEHTRGVIVVEELSLLPISSTDIRRQIAWGFSPNYLIPSRVWSYIQQHGLYGASPR